MLAIIVSSLTETVGGNFVIIKETTKSRRQIKQTNGAKLTINV